MASQLKESILQVIHRSSHTSWPQVDEGLKGDVAVLGFTSKTPPRPPQI